MIILGIDTSCDDTSVAVLREREVLSSIVSSQVPVHALFGGVVPEIASRKHVEVIDTVCEQALGEAGVSLADIDAVAVTQGPGLIGSVLVGLLYAKGICAATGKPIIGVNHVEAHAMAVLLEKEVEFPFVSLIVSGGHTVILRFEAPGSYRIVGSTRDDAVGEAFDKIAKYLKLGYPGGCVIEDLSIGRDRGFVAFPRPMMGEDAYDFSFSGLKTAFINYFRHGTVPPEVIPDVLASFQEAACDVLSFRTLKAARDAGISRVVVGGGVAANRRLREVFLERAGQEGMEIHFPSVALCTDNAAMIAKTGFLYAHEGRFSSLDIRGYSRMVRTHAC